MCEKKKRRKMKCKNTEGIEEDKEGWGKKK